MKNLLKSNGEKTKCVYIDMTDTLMRWEDNPDYTPEGTKEVFCGVTPSGEELIRFARIDKECLKLLKALKQEEKTNSSEKKYQVKLISSNPKIYTNAINQCFELGFATKDIISAEEFFDASDPYLVANPYAYKEKNKDILISSSPKNSSKSKIQRDYLGIDEKRQLRPEEMREVLKKRTLKKQTLEKEEVSFS